MRKIIVSLLLVTVSLCASAQFEKGTRYANLSLSEFGLNYSKAGGFCLGLQGTGGYFFADSWMVTGKLGWEHRPHTNIFEVGAGTRYYLVRNGLYFGGALGYNHVGTKNKNDNFFLTPEVGYCFYLNDHVSIEPAVYVDLCLNHFKDYTKVGLRIGFGYYF